jgi:hypothetical protein
VGVRAEGHSSHAGQPQLLDDHPRSVLLDGTGGGVAARMRGLASFGERRRFGAEDFGSDRAGFWVGLGRTIQLYEVGELAKVSCLRRDDGKIVMAPGRL